MLLLVSMGQAEFDIRTRLKAATQSRKLLNKKM